MPVPLIDASRLECRFPVEGAGLSLTVCGAPITAGPGAYCGPCRRRAYERTLPEMTVPARLDPKGRERDTTPDLVEVFA